MWLLGDNPVKVTQIFYFGIPTTEGDFISSICWWLLWAAFPSGFVRSRAQSLLLCRCKIRRNRWESMGSLSKQSYQLQHFIMTHFTRAVPISLLGLLTKSLRWTQQDSLYKLNTKTEHFAIAKEIHRKSGLLEQCSWDLGLPLWSEEFVQFKGSGWTLGLLHKCI